MAQTFASTSKDFRVIQLLYNRYELVIHKKRSRKDRFFFALWIFFGAKKEAARNHSGRPLVGESTLLVVDWNASGQVHISVILQQFFFMLTNLKRNIAQRYAETHTGKDSGGTASPTDGEVRCGHTREANLV